MLLSKTNVCSCKARHLARSKTCNFSLNALKLLWYTQPILSLGNCPKRKLFRVASQQEGPGFRAPAEAQPFCAEFECSPLTQRKGRLICYSKLSVDMNISVDGCSSQYVSPLMNWWLIQGVSCPVSGGVSSRPPLNLKRINGFRKWMDNMYCKIYKKSFITV